MGRRTGAAVAEDEVRGKDAGYGEPFGVVFEFGFGPCACRGRVWPGGNVEGLV